MAAAKGGKSAAGAAAPVPPFCPRRVRGRRRRLWARPRWVPRARSGVSPVLPSPASPHTRLGFVFRSPRVSLQRFEHGPGRLALRAGAAEGQRVTPHTRIPCVPPSSATSQRVSPPSSRPSGGGRAGSAAPALFPQPGSPQGCRGERHRSPPPHHLHPPLGFLHPYPTKDLFEGLYSSPTREFGGKDAEFGGGLVPTSCLVPPCGFVPTLEAPHKCPMSPKPFVLAIICPILTISVAYWP